MLDLYLTEDHSLTWWHLVANHSYSRHSWGLQEGLKTMNQLVLTDCTEALSTSSLETKLPSFMCFTLSHFFRKQLSLSNRFKMVVPFPADTWFSLLIFLPNGTALSQFVSWNKVAQGVFLLNQTVCFSPTVSLVFSLKRAGARLCAEAIVFSSHLFHKGTKQLCVKRPWLYKVYRFGTVVQNKKKSLSFLKVSSCLI